MSENLTSYQTSLSSNIVMLGRYLRGKGFPIGPGDEADALNALTWLPLDKEQHFKEGLKAVFPKNARQYQQFDELYAEFWFQLRKAADSKIKKKPEKQNKNADAQKRQAQFNALKDWLNLSPVAEERETAAYSDLEVLTKTDFQDLSQEEMELIRAVLQRMAKRLAHRKSRLKKRSKKRFQLDIRQTVRYNMRQGGQLHRLIYSEKKERKLKLVLLCDVSRSMELYSRFFVHLIYAFQNAYDKLETFVFSTALHRVSDILNHHEFEKAFSLISERVPQWSGGTTIGSCLSEFSKNYAHSMLDKKTVVFILSDGWDTGAPEVMEASMAGIYKRARKLVWLNPLAGSPDFAPEALGMKTALPYIDVLAPAHNLSSLKMALLQAQKRRNLNKGQRIS